MLASLMLLLQVAGPPGEDDTASRAGQDCRGESGEIVVCGRQRDYRLGPVLPDRGPALPSAQARISPNKTIQSKVTSGEGYAGPVPRIMAGVTIAF